MAEIVGAVLATGILLQDFDQDSGIEDVDSHRCQSKTRPGEDAMGFVGFLLETRDAMVRIHLHKAEAVGLLQLHFSASDGQFSPAANVVVQESAVVHPVHMVGGQHQGIAGRLLFEHVDILVDGVSRSLVPPVVDSLLRRHDRQAATQLGSEDVPPELQVALQGSELILRQNRDVPQTRVQTV